MRERQLLGEVEQLVLLALLRLSETRSADPPDVYAVPIRDELRRHGVELSRGSIYVTLDRLERKGYIRSWFADPIPEPGGKARRLFRLERQGLAALRAAQRLMVRLQSGTLLAPGRGDKP